MIHRVRGVRRTCNAELPCNVNIPHILECISNERTSSLSINIRDLTLYDSGIQEALVGNTESFVSLVLLPLSFGCGCLESPESCSGYAVV